jgi:hypothetical protein
MLALSLRWIKYFRKIAGARPVLGARPDVRAGAALSNVMTSSPLT